MPPPPARGGYEPLADVPSLSSETRPRRSLAAPPHYSRADEDADSYPLTRLDREADDGSEVDTLEADELDGDNNGGAYPTAAEQLTLLRVSGPIPYQSFLIAVIELAERFSYYGCTVVLANFIQQDLPPGSTSGAGLEGQSGALGLGQRASTALLSFNTFFVYTTPLLGAYIADRYWGRLRTIAVACGFALVGHALLVVSALPSNIVQPERALELVGIALVVMGLGTGAIKANITPLVAEQVTQTELRIVVREDGLRVIVDPALTTSRIFMYFYLMINIGSLAGQLSMVYAEKYSGYLLAFLLPALVFLLCPAILYAARNEYVRSPPSGSVLADAFRLLRFAARPCEQAPAATFWERARPSGIPVARRPSWMNFSDEWVEELRVAVQACRVFAFFPFFWLAFNQMTTNLTSQAAVLDTHGLPNDILLNVDPLVLIILIPLCERFIYPAIIRSGVRFDPITRIAAGFLAATIAMLWAAFIQHRVYATSECGNMASGMGCTPIDLSFWAQLPSYLLIAVAEVLASVSGLEYAYTKAPENMRSVVMSIFLFQSAIGAVLGGAFVTLSADPLLEVNYLVLTVVTGAAGIVFWRSCRHLDQG